MEGRQAGAETGSKEHACASGSAQNPIAYEDLDEAGRRAMDWVDRMIRSGNADEVPSPEASRVRDWSPLHGRHAGSVKGGYPQGVNPGQLPPAKASLDWGEAPAIAASSVVMEPIFREFALRVCGSEAWLRTELIDAASEHCGCSPLTGARYLGKLTSRMGPLLVEKDALGQQWVRLR